MEFDYDYYRRVLLEVPLSRVIFTIFCILGTIIIAFVLKKPSKNETLNNLWNKKIIRLVYALFMSLLFLRTIFTPIGHLKYGIFLKDEKPKDALITEGKIEEIEEIRNPSTHIYKSIKIEGLEIHKPIDRNAHLITISDKQYYFMIKGDLQVGDYVEIKYLPKSTIVLEVKVIETE